jgi:pimeloyl-ACP methyl ester carboxylesterase
MPYAEIDEGISLYYELTGPEDGAVVLQFGGGLFGRHNFGLVNDGFRERLRLLSFDARGYGASAHPREEVHDRGLGGGRREAARRGRSGPGRHRRPERPLHGPAGCIAMEEMDLSPLVPKISRPLLMTNGTYDILCPPDLAPSGLGARKMAELNKNSLVEFPDIGHADLVECPADSVRIVTEFFEKALVPA